jgi:hypothetical protein
VAAYEVLLLNTAVPQIQAAQSGDTYVVPRDIEFSTVASFAAGTALLPSIARAGDLNTGFWFPAADTIAASTGGTERVRIDSSGNLGLGVTPSAWSGWKAYQVGGGAVANISSVVTAVGGNWYADGVGDKYYANGAACRLDVNNSGGFQFKIAPSGTAGNAITFSQVMTLDASGQLSVGTTSASAKITIGGSGANRISFDAPSGAGFVGYDGADDALQVASRTYIKFQTGSSYIERARITSGGDFQTSSGNSVQVGGTAARATTAGTNRVDIFDGTAPVGTLANGVSFYSTAGEARVMDAAGNATLLSPHDTETNEWIFHSKHTPSGKVLRIDVERLLRFVNDHFGLDAVKEFVEE